MTLVQDRSPAPGGPELLDEPVVCTRVEDVTHDVRSFTLARVDRTPVVFDPGQHLTVTVEVDGAELRRCYTVSSSARRPAELAITVKRVPGGPVSTWLHERLSVGDTLHVTGPHGRFSTVEHPATAYLFLSAGSGVTPAMSMVRTLHDAGDPADVVFVHSARTPSDIPFRRELERRATGPGFRFAAVCEADAPDERWEGPVGRLDLRTLLRLAPDLHTREVFTCGPPGYMAAVREQLTLAGVDPARCHEESFELGGGAALPGPTSVAGSTAGEARAVEFRRSGVTVECGPTESILSAAMRAGLRPPSMCGEGVCGTCMTGLLAGQVDMRHAGGIRPRDVREGRILLCSSVPVDDVVLDA